MLDRYRKKSKMFLQCTFIKLSSNSEKAASKKVFDKCLSFAVNRYFQIELHWAPLNGQSKAQFVKHIVSCNSNNWLLISVG
jgi:hypothetical protein